MAIRNVNATDSTFRPALLLMAGQGVAFVATFFTPVVLARVFDQSEFGTYKQLFLIYSTIYYIAQFGIAESLFYFLPTAEQRAGRYVANSLLFLAGVGVASGFWLATASGSVSHWLHNDALLGQLGLIAAF